MTDRLCVVLAFLTNNGKCQRGLWLVGFDALDELRCLGIPEKHMSAVPSGHDVAIVVEKGRLSKVLAYRGIQRVPVDEAMAGDIVAIAGLTLGTVADTICDSTVTEPLKALPIDPPTLSITVSINDSPLAGREGSKVQSRVIRDRLMREAESNVAIRVSDSEQGDAFDVAGRGELQLGVLIETMRRDGFELGISRPRVLFT